jgi:hypothetical protein
VRGSRPNSDPRDRSALPESLRRQNEWVTVHLVVRYSHFNDEGAFTYMEETRLGYRTNDPTFILGPKWVRSYVEREAHHRADYENEWNVGGNWLLAKAEVTSVEGPRAARKSTWKVCWGWNA